jgi:hypothetical protein
MSGLNYQGGNPIGRKVRALENEVAALKKVIEELKVERRVPRVLRVLLALLAPMVLPVLQVLLVLLALRVLCRISQCRLDLRPRLLLQRLQQLPRYLRERNAVPVMKS